MENLCKKLLIVFDSLDTVDVPYAHIGELVGDSVDIKKTITGDRALNLYKMLTSNYLDSAVLSPIAFLCDQRDCCRGSECDSECSHTTDIKHAVNFKKCSDTDRYIEVVKKDE